MTQETERMKSTKKRFLLLAEQAEKNIEGTALLRGEDRYDMLVLGVAVAHLYSLPSRALQNYVHQRIIPENVLYTNGLRNSKNNLELHVLHGKRGFSAEEYRQFAEVVLASEGLRVYR